MHSRHRAGPPGSRARRRADRRSPRAAAVLRLAVQAARRCVRAASPPAGPWGCSAPVPGRSAARHGDRVMPAFDRVAAHAPRCLPGLRRCAHAAPTSGLPCHGRASLRAGAETSRGQLAAWCRKVARRVCGEGEYAGAEVTRVAAHRFPVIVGVQQVALDEILAPRFKSSASDLQQSGCSAVSACSAAFCATVTWLQG